ncbi:S10 family peptidase [Fluviispira multicolorata]|uniref:S10 family peptidase n=1 Tax=Fluviispira multicolorata TaxID=2654512 RepID=UPI001B871B82|nr:peptidase S1 [Fluviispira multicolorata]
MFIYSKTRKQIMVITISFLSLSSCGKKAGDTLIQLEKTNSLSELSVEKSSGIDKSYNDKVIYGGRPDDFVIDTNEGTAITQHTANINGEKIKYTAKAGHLVTVDPDSSKPNAKIFYIAFMANEENAATRPVTFIYNGGPGSAAVWLLLGSFSPVRIKTSMPDFTPPAPYTIEENPDSLLDKTDLIFINPVGTGYSTAISPYKNRDFWGVDQDAASLTAFIKRYLTKYERWNSPKFLMGESYGTPRSAVASFMLHKDGIDLNGITMISSILDYSKWGNPEGILPTLAANAWYHHKTLYNAKLPEYMNTVIDFSSKSYGPFMSEWQKNYFQFYNLVYENPDFFLKMHIERILKEVQSYEELINELAQGNQKEWELSEELKVLLNNLVPMNDMMALTAGSYIGISPSVIKSQSELIFGKRPLVNLEDFAIDNLLIKEGKAIGIYDGRATGINTGIAKNIRELLSRDPSIVNVQGAYTVGWNLYLNELKYSSQSTFQSMNKYVGKYWDYKHIDPTGVNRGGNTEETGGLYTAGDLAATMSVNPDLKVFQASGYFDSVTPFFQTDLDLAGMDLDSSLRKNILNKKYPSGHMIYLDGKSRTAMKHDLSKFYQSATHDKKAMQRILNLQSKTLNILR